MESVLKTNGVIKTFGNNKVLNGINMNINKGDIYGFIGKNGSGKTTFMRVVLSLTTKTNGDISFFNNKTIEEVGLKVGSLIESPGLYKNATAYENLKRFSILYDADESKIDELLKTVGLSKARDKKVKNFSLGMKQRLGIAIALLGEPEFLLLDEPINGLDPEGIKEIRDVILKLNKEKGITFLISSHLLDELSKIVTKYGILNNGVLVEEIGAKELHDKCANKLVVDCDDPVKAKEILAKTISEKNLVINKNTLEVHSDLSNAAKINEELVKKGIAVSALYPNYDSLEEYFMKRIGG